MKEEGWEQRVGRKTCQRSIRFAGQPLHVAGKRSDCHHQKDAGNGRGYAEKVATRIGFHVYSNASLYSVWKLSRRAKFGLSLTFHERQIRYHSSQHRRIILPDNYMIASSKRIVLAFHDTLARIIKIDI